MSSDRPTRDRTKYECAYCGARFERMTNHMTHVVQVHDTGARRKEDRLRRPITCWRCGTKDVHPGGADGWFYCDCGWVLPRNWVNGQLAGENDEETSDANGD